jgi:hypothetical protein
MSISSVLSATCQAIGCVTLGVIFIRFVLVQSPLVLRNFRCHWFGALFHNKANNSRLRRWTRQKPRLFLNR